jgi:hypothetical protein
MSNAVGSHAVGSPNQSIVQTSPTVTPDQTASTESPPSDVAAGETPAASPVPSPSAGATGKSVAPIYFPVGTGKTTGKTVGTQGVLVTPPTATKNPSGQTTPAVITVGPSPIPNPTPTPVKTTPPPAPTAPVVNGVSPASGPSGIQVTINGSNFNGTKQVKFGNNAASSFSINSAQGAGVGAAAAGTQITVTVPPGTGTVPVTVTGPGGTSGSGVLFTYVGPSIATVNPLFGPPAGGTSVNLTGSNFNGTTRVLFGSQPAQSFTVDPNGQRITAISPPYFGVQEFDISVTTPVGTSNPAPNDQQFDYGPGITNNDSSGLNPAQGPYTGTSVTISGINFGSSPSVTFNGVAGQVTSVNNTQTQIVVTTPPRTGSMVGNQTVPAVVTTAGGQSDSGPSFTYLPPPAPTVDGLSPKQGPVTGTTTVAITGTNFLPPTGGQVSVSFGGRAATVVTVSPTSIICTAPAGAAPGPVDVQVTAIGGQSATNPGDNYTYTP